MVALHTLTVLSGIATAVGMASTPEPLMGGVDAQDEDCPGPYNEYSVGSKVYFDVSYNDNQKQPVKHGRLVFGLFDDLLPTTTEKFRELVTGHGYFGVYFDPRKASYRGGKYSTWVSTFDFSGEQGRVNVDKLNERMNVAGGGFSVKDEAFVKSFSPWRMQVTPVKGVLMMSTQLGYGNFNVQTPDFFVATGGCTLGSRHVGVGKLVEGEDVLDALMSSWGIIQGSGVIDEA